MSARQRIVRASIGAFMAATCALGLGGFSAVSASADAATPAVHHGCPLGHRGHYPPGQCRIFFNKGVYHRHNHVRFESGKVFRAGEKVNEVLFCNHARYRRHVGSTTAHRRGRAKDSFRLRKSTPFGKCTLRLTGKHSHIRVRGSFRVHRRHHHHHHH